MTTRAAQDQARTAAYKLSLATQMFLAVVLGRSNNRRGSLPVLCLSEPSFVVVQVQVLMVALIGVVDAVHCPLDQDAALNLPSQ